MLVEQVTEQLLHDRTTKGEDSIVARQLVAEVKSTEITFPSAKVISALPCRTLSDEGFVLRPGDVNSAAWTKIAGVRVNSDVAEASARKDIFIKVVVSVRSVVSLVETAVAMGFGSNNGKIMCRCLKPTYSFKIFQRC